MSAEIKPLASADSLAPEFVGFPSISRLSRECVVTEKLDGTNAQIHITDDGRLFAGSRSRWITPEQDNYGFARWVQEHYNELLTLGPGYHFGEWWGSGIQRGYGLTKGDKRFSLFNVGRWVAQSPNEERGPLGEKQEYAPACCSVVPVLWRGTFDSDYIEKALAGLQLNGSEAAPGFGDPEGIVVYHEKSGALFKKTLGDDGHKGVVIRP